jgi:2,3-bisphosphoglycerate-dependent phosphoglycerate mutase
MTHTLILLRHGNSEWNQKNLFTGWVDVDLTDQGRAEAARAGELMLEAGIKPDVLFTSVLRRAMNTAHIALDAMGRNWVETHRAWQLNERHYGALQGKDKAQTLAEYGPEQFQIWRRSFDVPPPEIDDTSEFSQAHDDRYANLASVPKTECLKDVLVRMLPFWESDIVPAFEGGKTILITAHGNSLRALVKHLEGIGDDEIAELNIPTGIPLVYSLDDNFMPLGKGVYLDPVAAQSGAAAVSSQGKN